MFFKGITTERVATPQERPKDAREPPGGTDGQPGPSRALAGPTDGNAGRFRRVPRSGIDDGSEILDGRGLQGGRPG